MALIKIVIVIRTYFNVVINYKKSILGILFIIISAGFLVSAAYLFLWPFYLYNERLEYFKYPDKRSKKDFIDYYEK